VRFLKLFSLSICKYNFNMGGSSSSDAQTAALQQLQEATVAPISDKEANQLFTRAGKACCWKDANEYAFRLRQLEIINYAVQTLSKGLYPDPQYIDFKRLHDETLNYLDVNDKPADNHEWTLISEDLTFKGMREEHNLFKDFETYFDTNAGKGPADMKKDFESIYLRNFLRLRDGLIQLMSSSCGDA
jgi:hypothetical protein